MRNEDIDTIAEELEVENFLREIFSRTPGAKLIPCTECGDWHYDDDPTCPIVNGAVYLEEDE